MPSTLPTPPAAHPQQSSALVEYDDAVVLALIRDVVRQDGQEGLVFALDRKRRTAGSVVQSYSAKWSQDDRCAFLLLLAQGLGPIAIKDQASSAVEQWKSQQLSFLQLRAQLTPPVETFVKFVASVPHGSHWLIVMRGHLRQLLRRIRRRAREATAAAKAGTLPRTGALGEGYGITAAQGQLLHELDDILRELFSTQQGMRVQSITSRRTELLEYIRAKEGVHPIRSGSDLRRRVGGKHRVCLGLFHPNIPSSPLAFVEIAMCNAVATNIDDILRGEAMYDSAAGPPVAVFYSVTNPFTGLQGLQLGSYLLFLAMHRLSRQDPRTTFVTLSPVPGFRAWLLWR